MKFISRSAEETQKAAGRLAKALPKASILCLKGDLGSGKTTFVKGLASGLGLSADKVNSPTFVVMNIYEGKLPVYHFDLYRLETPEAINAIGYEEFFYGEGISVIEWSERLGKLMPQDYLEISFEHKTENERELQFSAKGQKYADILKKFKI
jgi:tRNA threonylcarbamoyladenosine biosynthesis protein TsaE